MICQNCYKDVKSRDEHQLKYLEGWTCRKGTRSARQDAIFAWATEAFGDAEVASFSQRALRLLEETIELYQACEGDPALAHKLIDFIFDRPPGDIKQELGGVSVTLLVLCSALETRAEDVELAEVARILSKPVEHFRERNKAKNGAGFITEEARGLSGVESMLKIAGAEYRKHRADNEGGVYWRGPETQLEREGRYVSPGDPDWKQEEYEAALKIGACLVLAKDCDDCKRIAQEDGDILPPACPAHGGRSI